MNHGTGATRRDNMKEKLKFKNSKGNSLSAILSDPTGDKEKPIIIFCHGFTSSKNSRTWLALEPILNEKEISTFRFDIFGHGESEGKFENITISEAVDDILNVINYLKDKGYSKIGLVGSSFGGMASIMTASETDDLFVLALKSPVSDYYEVDTKRRTKKEIEEWKTKGFVIHKSGIVGEKRLNYSFFEDFKNNDAYEAAKEIKIPTLIVHGDKDTVVPIEQSKKTAAIIKDCRLEIIEGVGHDYSKPEDFDKMIKLIAEFIVEKS